MPVLQLRRGAGGLRVVGTPPATITLSAAFIARELANGATLTLTVPTVDDDLVYTVTGFEEVESDDPTARLNFTGWTCELVTP